MPPEVSGGLETDLQLVRRLDMGTYDIDLEAGVPALVEINAYHEHDVVGHFDAKLAAVGAHRGPRDRVTAERGQTIGNAAKIVERHRSEWRAGHSESSGFSCERASGNGCAGRASRDRIHQDQSTCHPPAESRRLPPRCR